jgi:hypothetical protein
VLLLERLDAADARPENDPDAIVRVRKRASPSGALDGFEGRRNAELCEAIGTARITLLHKVDGVEVVDLRRDLRPVVGYVESSYRSYAGTSGNQTLPRRLGPYAEGRDGADTRNGDAP